MKILKVKYLEIKLDDDIFEQYKDCKFSINYSKYLRLSNGKILHKLIKPEFKRIKPKDGDWTNLTRENLIEFIGNPNKQKEWYQIHNKKVKERVKTWRNENKEYVYECEKKKRYKLKYKYINLKSSAKKRGREFNLSEEEYTEILSKGCFYTGIDLINNENYGHCLDRIDNSKGYTKDNVIPCIGWVNKMRQNILTVEETKVAVDAILKLRKEKLDNQ